MRDKFVRGFAAGVAGGIAADIISATCMMMNIIKLCFIQWAGYVLYGSKPERFLDYAVALLTQLMFSGILGIVFIYIIMVLGSTHYLFKGWIYGIAIWFIIYALTLVAQIPGLQNLNAATALLDIVSASVYGLVMAETEKRLEVRI